MAEAKAKSGIFTRIKKFFKDLRSETKKIVWPGRKQVVNNTMIVIAAIFIVGAMIWVFDSILTVVVGLIL